MERLSKKSKGSAGEEFTAKFLKRRGFTILKRNFSCKTGEIDIIAQNHKYIIFVEVKTRGSKSLCSPAEYVDFRKQQRIFKTASFYLSKFPVELQPRFDISEVYFDETSGGKPKINYIENAFMQEADYAAF